MWFMLGFLFGIVFTVGAIFLLAWWVNEHEQNGKIARWLDKHQNTMEAKFDRKVKPASGSIGRFVLRNGEIVRANDDG